MLFAKHHKLDAYIPMLRDAGFVCISDLWDCPENELKCLASKMKPPHAKLLRMLCGELAEPQCTEWTNFVSKRGRTFQDFCCTFTLPMSMPKESTAHFNVPAERYIQVLACDLIWATDAELEELSAPMRPVERRRLLRAIGRPEMPDDNVVRHEQQQRKVAADWACFVFSPGCTINSLFEAAGLSAFTEHFESGGYAITKFLLDASMDEFAAISVSMRPIERRRLLHVLGRSEEDRLMREAEKARGEKEEWLKREAEAASKAKEERLMHEAEKAKAEKEELSLVKLESEIAAGNVEAEDSLMHEAEENPEIEKSPV